MMKPPTSIPPLRSGARLIDFATAAASLPATTEKALGEPRSQPAAIAAAIVPTPSILPEDYFRPKGMGPRQHNKVFHRILRSTEGPAYCKAMDRAHAAARELEEAIRVQHAILFTVMLRHYPAMTRRIRKRS
jgi:hypothetical protein